MPYVFFTNGETSPTVTAGLNGNVAMAIAHEALATNPHGATLTQDTIIADAMTLDGVDAAAALAALLGSQPRAEAVHPEWPGVVWDPEDALLSVGFDEGGGRNFYRIAAATDPVSPLCHWRFTTPPCFYAWDPTVGLSIAIRTTDLSGDATVGITPYRTEAGGTIHALTAKTGLMSSSPDTWRVVSWTAAELSGGDWVAGDTLSLAFDLIATSTVFVYLSEIALTWTERAYEPVS